MLRMARKSKLSAEQWAEVDRRALEGESQRALAREFGLSNSALTYRYSKIGKHETVREVAAKIVDAERSLAALPIAAQHTAHNLAAKLRSISENLASAAMHGAATAHRLSALANAEVAKVDDAQPLNAESLEAMKGVAALTKLANDSSSIALNLLAANKDAVQKLEIAPPPVKVIRVRHVKPPEVVNAR